MAEGILAFGTAGIPHSADKRSSVCGVARVRALGLDAMEVQFVQRVGMGPQTAIKLRNAAEQSAVRLSAHAPYYINLNSQDAEKLRASRERLMQAARVAARCGAGNVVFHVGYYHGDTPALVFERVRERLRSVVSQLRDEGVKVWLRPETGGRPSQFGALSEILRLSAEVEGVRPCIDFGHLHARTLGGVNSYQEFTAALEEVAKALGESALQDLHIHLAGIAYSRAGERRHLTLGGSDLRYEELLQVLVEQQAAGTVICESPNLEQDAVLLQRTYRFLKDGAGQSRGKQCSSAS